jgi:hypothetical protein
MVERAHNGRNGDPSPNVLDLVAAAERRQDDLRIAEGQRQNDLAEMRERHSRELDAQREKAANSAKLQEASRIDALLQANTGNVALALGKTETQALAQDRRIAILEQNQYSGAGREIQRTEGRQVGQWLTGLVIGGVLAVVELGLRLSGH